MANIFMTPEQVAAAEKAQLTSVGSSYESAVDGQLFGLGNSLGNAIGRGFGVDTRSQAVKDAQFITQTVKGVDLRDNDSIMNAANTLMAKGFQPQAERLMGLIQPTRTPDPTIVDEFILIEGVGDTIKKFLMQRDSTDRLFKVGEVSDTANTANTLNLPGSIMGDVNFDDLDLTNTVARLANRPEFSSFFGDSDQEDYDFEALAGQVKGTANQLKRKHRAALIDAFDQGRISRNDILKEMMSDDEYIRAAFKQYVTGGGLNQDTDDVLIGAPEPKVSGEVDASDLDTLQATASENAAMQAALDQVSESLVGDLVVGDPRKKEFRLGGISPQAVAPIFSNMDEKTDEQIMNEFVAKGFVFNDNLFESHAHRWQLMRDNPEATATFLGASGSGDFVRDGILADYIERYEGNPQAVAEAAAIFRYLRRLNQPRAKDTAKYSSGRGRGYVTPRN